MDNAGERHYRERLEARMEDLEMRIAFQDDLMAILSDQVAIQEQALQRLWDANRLLQDQVKNVRDPQAQESAEEGPPPHY